MTSDEVLSELEAMGTAQNRKIYARHGVQGEMFGVSYGNLKQLKKRIRKDQALAQALWASGNHDARILATMLADAKTADRAMLTAWADGLDSYPISDAFSGMVTGSPLARPLMEQWIESESEWIGQAGWNVLAHLAIHDRSLPDGYFVPFMAVIEREIHARKNRTRYAMNNALIAIGIRNDVLEQQALVVAARIGSVSVDHGETQCETPDAAAYIAKTRQRQLSRA